MPVDVKVLRDKSTVRALCALASDEDADLVVTPASLASLGAANRLEIGIPLAAGLYLLRKQHDPFGAAVCLFWCGTALVGAGIYALIGEIAGEAGSAAPLAFVIAACLAGLTARSFAERSAASTCASAMSVRIAAT